MRYLRLLSTLSVVILVMLRMLSMASAADSIRSVDFRNMAYYSKNLAEKIRFRRSMYSEKEGEYKAQISAIVYIDFDRDGREEAAITIGIAVPGTAGWFMDYYVFALSEGKPRQIFYESREKGDVMRVRGRTLIITAPYWATGDAHCCPSDKETKEYRWSRKGFVLKSRRLLTGGG